MSRCMRKISLLCFSVTLFFSCSNKEKYGSSLYSIDSLLTAQVKYLSENKAALTKETRLGDKHDKISFTPKDTLAWKKELEMFAALDVINKPVNKDLYQIESLADDKSNLRVKAFTAKTELPVKYLRIYYQQAPDKIRKIEAQFNESNSLYESSRSLTMEFHQVDNKTVLTSYAIAGGQKMFLADSVQYKISGALSISN